MSIQGDAATDSTVRRVVWIIDNWISTLKKNDHLENRNTISVLADLRRTIELEFPPSMPNCAKCGHTEHVHHGDKCTEGLHVPERGVIRCPCSGYDTGYREVKMCRDGTNSGFDTEAREFPCDPPVPVTEELKSIIGTGMRSKV